MPYIVYKTTNNFNDRFYVGVHKVKDINIFDGYIGSGTLITRYISKYGKENFIHEILISSDYEDEAYSIEGLLVKTYKEDPRSLNINKGGYGRTRTDSIPERILEVSNIRRKAAVGVKKYNDGITEFQFRSSDPSNRELTIIEFKKFIDENPQFKVGRTKQTPRKRDFSMRKYNDGIKEYNFHTLNKDIIETEFKKFIDENPQFKVGAVPKGKRIKISPMIGARKYNDGKNEFLFRSSDLSNKELTDIEFKNFLKLNNFYSGKIKTYRRDHSKGLKHYNDGKLNFTFKASDINNINIINAEFKDFLKTNPIYRRGQLQNKSSKH